jgi:AmiR/NasT family two-component response regulator
MASPTSPDPVDVLVEILMTRHGVGPSTAHTMVRRAAIRSDVTIDQLADVLVADASASAV